MPRVLSFDVTQDPSILQPCGLWSHPEFHFQLPLSGQNQSTNSPDCYSSPSPPFPISTPHSFVSFIWKTKSSDFQMALRSLATRKTLTQGLNSTRLAQSRALQTFSLPDLPYDYGALEPAISGEIMQLHHQKHHQTYITNYNKALEQLHEAIQKGDSSTVVKLQSAIKFNGGGKIFFFLLFLVDGSTK